MAKVSLSKPTLICYYGFPGAGKSYITRNLQKTLSAAIVSADRIRNELFRSPRRDNQENAIVAHLMNYMAEEFLSAGISVIYDSNAGRAAQRRYLRELARRHKAHYLLIWVQIDIDSSFARAQRRDHRTSDDKFAGGYTRQAFDNELALMQNPKDEDYLVISGKHAFTTQKSAVMNRLYQLGLIEASAVQQHITEPGLVNLVPNLYGGRVDMSRRNINID